MTLERRYWKSWRIALAYIVFSVLALALFATPLLYGWRVNVGTLRIFVPEDMQKLPDLFNREGPAAVASAIRARTDATGMEVIAFAGPGKELLAGTLGRWPDEIPDLPGTYGHVIDPGDGSSIRVVVSHVILPGGYQLLIGRQSSGLMSLQGNFWYGMAAAMTIVIGLGGALAWVFARRARDARHSEERTSLALEASEEGHFDLDVVTDNLFISDRMCDILGYPRGSRSWKGADFMSRYPFYANDVEVYNAVVGPTMAKGGPDHCEFEFRIARPSGEVRWLSTRAKITRDANGNAVRRTGMARDITDAKLAAETLRTMELELRRAQRLEAIGTLAGGIAHDFNNILGAILGYGEMAMRGAKKGTRLRRDLDSIMLAGERGRSLVDRVLAFSRSGVGERVPVHVEAVVREALDQTAANLPPNVTIAQHLRAGRAAMLGDSTQVHQVVMNLAANAVQAMPQGGVLRVVLEIVHIEAARPATLGSIAPGGYIVLTLSDAGTGIREDVLERIFDPFFTTKDVGVGTGLGLSLVHGIVISVGGAIDVATGLGEGTTFTVYLPRSGDAPAKLADEGLPLPRGDGQRVLVVDDEEALVCLAIETLEGLGYKPSGFTSSVNALEEFRADPDRFDAILTDERMPGVTGLVIIREVRRIKASIPILLMTGFVGGAVTEARALGANDVLKKPLLARDLATSLARALRS